jgi:hypothetical protein
MQQTSNRKLEKQMKAFKATDIPIHLCGHLGSGHHSNQAAVMPDTPAARKLLKKVGGSIRRDQSFKESKMERML